MLNGEWRMEYGSRGNAVMSLLNAESFNSPLDGRRVGPGRKGERDPSQRHNPTDGRESHLTGREASLIGRKAT